MAQTAEGGGRAETRRSPIGVPVGKRLLTLSNRTSWWVVAVAMALASALVLWLNRGSTYSVDQFDFVEDSPGLGIGDLFDPHNGHLVLTTRLAYKVVLETGGIDYLPFRILGLLALLFAVGCFYALLKRWIGSPAALAPTVLLLFFGSAWQHVVVPVGFTSLLSIALGLAALLALEREDGRGDIAACLLLTLSVATFSTGLAFLAGTAVAILLRREDRARRAWIFLVPLAAYAVWWLQAPSLDTGVEADAEASNVLLIPSYVTQSLVAVIAAILGVNYDFGDPAQGRVLFLGAAVAVLATLALGIRLARGEVPGRLWVALAVLLGFWSLLTLSVDPFLRPPGAIRYVFMGAVGVLLVAAAAVSGIRWSERALLVLLAVTAFSLATNVALLREGAEEFRDDYSARAKAQFTALELARGAVDSGFDPSAAAPDASPVSSPAGTYFTLRDRYGSPAFTVGELEDQDESARATADQVLAAALGVSLAARGQDAPSRGCRTVRAAAPQEPIRFDLPSPGAILATEDGTEAALALGRFADRPSAQLGNLFGGVPSRVAIPPDELGRPWSAEVTGTASVEVCGLP